ncbi:MAG TPA: apolipoprotein N-acyltransferase [Terriglobales bacterium]|nr:apolipoprotein N-acyltransferase [Terriglobales bacterium]
MRRIHRNSWLLAILSGVLEIVIFPLPGLHMVCWIALAPLLVAVLHAREADTLQLSDSPGVRLVPANPAQGFLLGYLSGIIWYAGTCYWVYNTMHQYGGLSAPAALGVLFLFCLYLALYHGAFGALLALVADPGRPLSRRALLAAPFLWVAVELARTRITGFPWDLLGTVQVDNIPLARVAGFTGVYGLSLEIMLVNTAFATAFLVRRDKRKTLLIAGLCAAVALQAGRWIEPPRPPADHTAYLVQQNIPILDSSGWTKDYLEGTLRDLLWISEKPTSEGTKNPDLVVWPESPAPFYASDPLFREAVSSLARQMHTWVLTGSIGVRNATQVPEEGTAVYNSAALIGPDGEWVARYDKVHLVPFGEYLPFKKIFSFAGGLTKEVGDFSRGTSRTPLNAGGQKLGVFICYESVFPDEVRQFAKNGAQVLVNISNDGWYGDSGAYAQHLLQSRMRAVENNRWLLLDTNTGVTASINPYGRIEKSLPRKVRATLQAPYALTNVTTFYSRHGDWFASLCAIISLGTLLTLFPFGTKTGR